MKTLSLMLLGLAPCVLLAQLPDTRATLKVKSDISELSVSPTGALWLASHTGYVATTPEVGENWTHITQGEPNSRKDPHQFDQAFFDRVSFFNSDTALLTGYINGPDGSSRGDYLLRTTNGGQSWEQVHIGLGSWVYDVQVLPNGHAWLGGSSGAIYYSDDYGSHWRVRNFSLEGQHGLHSIHMENKHEGIAGDVHNGVFTTTDNWKSQQKILTPKDQEKYSFINGYAADRINKVRLLGPWMVIDQGGHLFYSDRKQVDWQPFSKPLYQFEVDPEYNRFVAVGTDHLLYAFADPRAPACINPHPFKSEVRDLVAVDGQVYALDDNLDVYRVNAHEFVRATPMTTEYPIGKPDVIDEGSPFWLGIKGKHLYRSDNSGLDWYRIHQFAENMEGLTRIDQTTVIVRNGHHENFRFDLETAVLERYASAHPLADFLKHDITEVVVANKISGCFISSILTVWLKRQQDSFFVQTGVYTNDQKSNRSAPLASEPLEEALAQFDANPGARPTLKEFHIHETDVANYLDMISTKEKALLEFGLEETHLQHYRNIPSQLPTIDPADLNTVFDHRGTLVHPNGSQFRITLRNEQGDQLVLSQVSYGSGNPWHLPLRLNHNGIDYLVYDPAIPQWIKAALPEDFPNTHVMDNKNLLLRLGHQTKQGK